MRDRDTIRKGRLDECHEFLAGDPHPVLSVPLPALKREIAHLGTAVANLQKHWSTQRNNKYAIKDNSRTRTEQIVKLRDEFIKPLRQAARANVREMPELAAKIRLLPLRSSLADTLKNAKAILAVAKKHQKFFLSCGIPANLPKQMQRQIEIIEKGRDSVSNARTSMKKDTLGFEHWLREGEYSVRKINVILKNHLPQYEARNGNSAFLETWAAYYKIKKPRARRKPQQLVPVL